MQKVKIHIWHDVTGRILGIGQPVILPQDMNVQVIPLAGENQLLFETEIEETKIKDLHKTHIVDFQNKVLVQIKK